MRGGFGGAFGGYQPGNPYSMISGMPASYHTAPPMAGGGSMFQRALVGADPLYDQYDAPPPLVGTDPGRLGGGLGFLPPQRRY